MTINKTQFILNYATTFLSTWAATNYSDFCARDQHDLFVDNAPIEDAFFMAEELWNNKLFKDEINKITLEKTYYEGRDDIYD